MSKPGERAPYELSWREELGIREEAQMSEIPLSEKLLRYCADMNDSHPDRPILEAAAQVCKAAEDWREERQRHAMSGINMTMAEVALWGALDSVVGGTPR